MHKRRNAQRRHLIQTLEILLYELHTLAFFLSPSVFAFACRLVSQLHCTKQKEMDSSKSLRICFIIVLLLNVPTLWQHATPSNVDERAIILDFVGLAYTPSKFQLFCSDFIIIFLQLLLASIAYDTPPPQEDSDVNDVSRVPAALPTSQSLGGSTFKASPGVASTDVDSSSYVVDVRLRPIIARLRQPPQIPISQRQNALLPFPNTTPWPIPGMGMFLPRIGQSRREAVRTPPIERAGQERRIPGGMDTS